MNNRNSELEATMNRMLDRDFTKVAQPGMPPPMGGGMAPPPVDQGMMPPPMDGGMAPPMTPEMMPPEMLPPAGEPMMDPGMMPPPLPPESSAEADKGMKDVAIKALDMAHETIKAVIGSDQLSPSQMSDAAAAALSSSDALDGISASDIASQV